MNRLKRAARTDDLVFLKFTPTLDHQTHTKHWGSMSHVNGLRSSDTIESKSQLVDYLASGNKPESDWRIGTEHEKFGFQTDDLAPPTYEGARGIRRLLEGMTRFGWEPVIEGGLPIALLKDQCSITLEPAGQLELSGAPLPTVHDTCNEISTHLRQVREVADELNLGFLGVGFQPKFKREEMPWMPKGRYKIMREYMPKVGSLGLDMMTRTCTVQVNLDYSSEADMVKKFRVSLALQPIATALFADSPFVEGKDSGYLSYRSHIWTDTDRDRTGMLPFVFEEGFGFERYVDYILNVPMYFAYRNKQYLDASGQDFRQFMRGELAILPGEKPTFGDFGDHLTTAFPEVRLKKFLEMRGADGGPWNRLCALPAFWVGLLYDQSALDAAWDLVRDMTIDEHQALRDNVPKLALNAPHRGGKALALAVRALEISAHGLRNRRRLNASGADESIYLEPLIEFASAGICPAERKLELFNGAWKGDINRIFTEFAY